MYLNDFCINIKAYLGLFDRKFIDFSDIGDYLVF